jgi:hypothetical protein
MALLLPLERSGRVAAWLGATACALLGCIAPTPGRADEKPSEERRTGCLSEGEIRDEVSAKRIVPQVVALRAARAAAGGEAVRARLCHGEGGLVYAITALKRDGKVLRIDVDAVSGRVIERN